MNSTVISSQALTRPNWTLGEEEPELEELAEASLLQHHQERAESGEETEAASDVEAGEHSGGGQVEQQVPDPGQPEMSVEAAKYRHYQCQCSKKMGQLVGQPEIRVQAAEQRHQCSEKRGQLVELSKKFRRRRQEIHQ